MLKDGLELREGDIVLLHTGHYERTVGTPEYLTEFSGLEPRLRAGLIEQGTAKSRQPGHERRRPRPLRVPRPPGLPELGVTHFENVGPLEAVAGKRFTLFGFPLKIEPGTGSPVGFVAAVPVD